MDCRDCNARSVSVVSGGITLHTDPVPLLPIDFLPPHFVNCSVDARRPGDLRESVASTGTLRSRFGDRVGSHENEEDDDCDGGACDRPDGELVAKIESRK